MLYICIPAYNEAATIGVLMWRVRSVLQEYSREYEIVVYDDASSDSTRDVLEPYVKVLPLSVIGSKQRVGYPAAVEALLRDVSRRTRYPRRDAVVVMQGDFTDQPENIPELVRRFEGGADLVVGESPIESFPKAYQRANRIARWAAGKLLRLPAISDPFGTLRLFRISVVRDLIKAHGESPVLSGSGAAANLELLIKALKHSRRTEALELALRYDIRERPSRTRPMADALGLVRYSWSARRLLPTEAAS